MMTGAALLLAGLLLHWWSRPERQIPRAQARLLSAVEKRDFDALAAMIAADYCDRWRQDRAEVVRRSREVFGQFRIDADRHASAGNHHIRRTMALQEGIGGSVVDLTLPRPARTRSSLRHHRFQIRPAFVRALTW